MNTYQSQPLPEPEFDEREQADIISLAAELQRAHGQRSKLSDLERAAIEAGIEPRFVREAVMRRTQVRTSEPRPILLAASEEPEDPVWRVTVVAALFALPQAVLLHSVAREWYFGNVRMFEWLSMLALAVALGALLPARTSARRVAAALPALVTFCVILGDAAFHSHRMWLAFCWIAALQSMVAVATHVLRSNRNLRTENRVPL